MQDRAGVSPFRPLSTVEQERLTAKLTEQYARAHADLLRVLDRGNITDWRRAFTIQQIAQIENLTQGLDNAAGLWAQENVPALYKHGMWVAEGYLEPGGLSKLASPGEWTPMDLGMARLHDTAVSAIAENMALDLGQANNYCAQRIESMVARAQQMAELSGKGRAIPASLSNLDYLRETAEGKLQLKIRDASLDAMSRAFRESRTGAQASKDFMAELHKRGITSFVDRAGRQWNMETYADMVTETVSAEAQRHGMQNRLVEWGHDLVEVEGPSGSTDICKDYVGKVLSVTGQTEGYETVEAALAKRLLHPRCGHRLIPYVSEATLAA